MGLSTLDTRKKPSMKKSNSSLYVQTEVVVIKQFVLLCARELVLSADTLEESVYSCIKDCSDDVV